MDREAWRATIHRVEKEDTTEQLSSRELDPCAAAKTWHSQINKYSI